MRTWTLAALAMLGAAPSSANDTTAALKTGGLQFMKSWDISMEEEKLFISPTEIRVDYIYRNTGQKPVTSYVAFPMPEIGGSPYDISAGGDPAKDNFLDFSVTQDGAALKPELQQRAYSGAIDMTDVIVSAGIPLNPRNDKVQTLLKALPAATLDDWTARGLIQREEFDSGSGPEIGYEALWTLKSVYYWQTTFPVGKDIHVAHRYTPSVGGTVAVTYLEDGKPRGATYDDYRKRYCLDDTFVRPTQKLLKQATESRYYYENWISYILTTGNNWAGPIKSFTLTVDKGDPANYVSFCGTNVRKTGPTTFEMKATDFSPERDLDILLLKPNTGP